VMSIFRESLEALIPLEGLRAQCVLITVFADNRGMCAAAAQDCGIAI